jgi:tight adherence protein B
MLLILILLVFVLIGAAVFAFGWFVDDKRAHGRVMRERLAAVRQAENRQSGPEVALLRDELLSEIPVLNRILARSGRASRLQQYLLQAGLKVRAGKFLLICALVGASLGVAAFLAAKVGYAALLIGVLGAILPFAYVSWRRSRRFAQFEQRFPEAIELLGRALRAGHAFTTGVELIARELAEPVSGEFRKLFEEQKFGLPVREALLNFAERMPLVDVKFFVTAVMLQRETGGNLAEILDKLAYVIRERFKIARQVRVYTAQGRLTMIILLGLPPALLAIMTFVDRSFISVLYLDPIGRLLIVIGLVLQTLGFFLIRRIIHIQV